MPREFLHGFSLVELLTVIAIIGIVAGMLLAVLNKADTRAKRVTCINNLRELGIAFHEFSDDHNGNYPMQVPASDGGSQDYLEAAAIINGNFYFSYRFFQTLSNVLITPRLLVCPNDNRPAATNFATLRNANISYFSTAFARVGDANALLAGDRNLTNNLDTEQSRLLLTPENPLKWTSEMHQFRGNVLFADDHVEEWNNQRPSTFNAVMIFPPIIKTFNFDIGSPGGPPPNSSPPGNTPPPQNSNPGAPENNPNGNNPGNGTAAPGNNLAAGTGNSLPGNMPLPHMPPGNPVILTPPPAAHPDGSNAVSQFESNGIVADAVPSQVTNEIPPTATADSNLTVTLAPKKVPPPAEGFPWWLWLLLLLLILLVLYIIAHRLTQRPKNQRRR
jgi:prepilin-type N-terminal cleavage/methylation domain-containing protein